jgi:hypothetical protein
MTLWNVHEISFDFVGDLTDDPVVTLTVTTPAGPLTFLAEPAMEGTTMVLKGLHVLDSAPNAVGPGSLMVIAQAVMEGMDLDGLLIKGSVRSTGASPGHRPRDLRFARRVRPAVAAGQRSPQDD